VSNDTLTIDGFGPLPVVHPASAAELGEVVRRCAAEGRAVYPVGGGTMLDYGRPPTKPGVAVATTALDRVIDFPARDMTITVQAGITIARLREVTRAEGLQLPIDVPEPERSTLGGAIACNVSGPRRYGYGTFRDYVLGLTVVTDRGEEAKAGGRVVKNVAGYDLMKLHTGALGTLGVIAQVTLKLRPVPEQQAQVIVPFDYEQFAGLLELLHRSATRPVGLDFIRFTNFRATELTPKPWSLLVLYDGSTETVEWQRQQLTDELRGSGISATGSFLSIGSAEILTFPPKYDLVFRANVRPSGVTAFCGQLAQYPNATLNGQAGSGIVRGSLGGPEFTLAEARRSIQSLLQAAAAFDGNVVIERCPTEWKRSLPVWGRPPAALALMNAVKHALDPNGLFNPGRFVTDL
jgi:glycolate oxidase FAD binding subunit